MAAIATALGCCWQESRAFPAQLKDPPACEPLGVASFALTLRARHQSLALSSIRTHVSQERGSSASLEV